MNKNYSFKPNWGNHPNKMAAALYFNRKKHRNNVTPLNVTVQSAEVSLPVDVPLNGHMSTFDGVSPTFDSTSHTFDEGS